MVGTPASMEVAGAATGRSLLLAAMHEAVERVVQPHHRRVGAPAGARVGSPHRGDARELEPAQDPLLGRGPDRERRAGDDAERPLAADEELGQVGLLACAAVSITSPVRGRAPSSPRLSCAVIFSHWR